MTTDTTVSDIAQCIQKLNDENQRLRDALRSKERETLEDVKASLESDLPLDWSTYDADDALHHAIANVKSRLAALTPKGDTA